MRHVRDDDGFDAVEDTVEARRLERIVVRDGEDDEQRVVVFVELGSCVQPEMVLFLDVRELTFDVVGKAGRHITG